MTTHELATLLLRGRDVETSFIVFNNYYPRASYSTGSVECIRYENDKCELWSEKVEGGLTLKSISDPVGSIHTTIDGINVYKPTKDDLPHNR